MGFNNKIYDLLHKLALFHKIKKYYLYTLNV
jgi:hypothetical protein